MGRGANFNLNDCSDKSEKKCENNTFYTWDDIKNDKNWIVINEKVYDVTNFIKRHPGSEIKKKVKIFIKIFFLMFFFKSRW